MDSTELLTELISMDSSTKSGANQTVDFCALWLERHGLKVEVLENNGYKMLVSEIGKGNRTLILNGHVDTVPGSPEQLTPKINDGKLYGRGAADMKAGVAAYMCTLVELNKQELDCKVQLQIVSDEETGGKNCSKFLTENGYRGDFVICGEPTQLGIGLQSKGILQFEVMVKGKPAHSSRPWEGENAVIKAVEFFHDLSTLPFALESSEFYKRPSINLSMIEGGSVINQVPGVCKLAVDIRFLPGQSEEEIIEQIRSLEPGELNIISLGTPISTKREDPNIETLSSVITDVLQLEHPIIFGQHGSADGRF
ncbi:MAG TPA: M20/M25/M40 family metallo-hydrolase, partial [Chondromyces sp.]|nr:M20/M25/M40 family metallo-hydrolase [Chondromyces sp.]